MTVQEFLERLEGVRKSGDGWMACCPAHDDRHPSLFVCEGGDGGVTPYCHAGCSREQIAAGWGCDPRDLLPPPDPDLGRSRIAATYRYTDEAGTLLFEKVRLWPKSFRLRRPRPSAEGGWEWNLHGVRRVLYRLPAVMSAVAAGEAVWVVEGEKDADALAKAGICATTGSGGAGTWDDAWAEPLRGARAVIVVADSDEAGRAHAQRVAGSVSRLVGEVCIMEAAQGKDAADHLAAGLGVGDFVQTAVLPGNGRVTVMPAPVERQPSGGAVRLVDVHEFVRDQEPEQAEPLLGEARDTLIARSGLVLVGGPAHVGKTTFVVDLAVHLATGTDWLGIRIARAVRVVLIETEGTRQKFREKLAAKLAAWPGPAPAPGMLRVADQPWGPLDLADPTLRHNLAALLADVDVVIGDPVAKLGLRGVGSPEDVATLVGHLYKLGLFTGGPAWVLLHHLKHNRLGADLLEQLSGVWDRDPDTVLVLKRGESVDEVRLHWGKVRHGDAGKWLAHPWTLRHGEGESFEVVATGPRERDPEEWQRLRAHALDLLAQSAALGVTITEYRATVSAAGDAIGEDKAKAVLDELVEDELAERREKVPGRVSNAKPYFLLPRKGSEGAEGAREHGSPLAPATSLPPPLYIEGEGEGANGAAADAAPSGAPSDELGRRLDAILEPRIANGQMTEGEAQGYRDLAEHLPPDVLVRQVAELEEGDPE